MMFIQGEKEIFFIDRDNSVFEVEGLKFFNRKNLDHHLKDTLLDGVIIFHTFNMTFIILKPLIQNIIVLGDDY